MNILYIKQMKTENYDHYGIMLATIIRNTLIAVLIQFIKIVIYINNVLKT